MTDSNSVKKKILTVVIAIIVVLVSFGAGYLTRSALYDEEIQTLDYILKMYHKYYYEDLEGEELIQTIERSILDVYSDYYTPEEYELIHKTSQGSHEGIGISVSENYIYRVNWNSPSDRAGITAGGRIVGIKAVGAENYSDYDGYSSLNEAISQFDAYTDFLMKVDYDGVEKEFTLAREEYTETFVRYYDREKEYGFRETDGEMQFVEIGANTVYDLQGSDDIAVIDYNGFSGLRKDGYYGSAAQFKAVLGKFKEQNKSRLILDLRNNGGGFMNIMSEVASHLIGEEDDKKYPVSVVRDKYEKENIYYSAKVDYSGYAFENIIVLCNAGTASASEALIGAMLDYDYDDAVKVIVEPYYSNGNPYYRTYGKGIMQTTYENVLTGGAIKLTTAKLFWPKSNVSIHGTGVNVSLNDTLYGGEKTKIYNASENGCVHDAVSFMK